MNRSIQHLFSCALLFAIMVLGCAMPTSVAAQLLVNIQPSSLDYGVRPTSSTPIRGEILIRATPENYVRLTSISWRSGASPSSFSFITSPTPGDAIDDSGKVFDFEVTFSSAEYISDVLVLEFECHDGLCVNNGVDEQTVEISYRAKVDCLGTDENCTAEGPECVIDFNSEYYVQFSNPNFESSVRDFLSSTIRTHYAGYKDYSLPIDILWGVAGLGDLFEPINGPCCACGATCNQCIPGNCAEDVNFSINYNFPNTARFSWNSPDGAPLVVQSKSNHLYSATITLPARINGSVVVGAGFVELFYSSAQSAPTLDLQYLGPDGDYPSGSTLFEGVMLCTGSGLRQAVVRHPEPGQDIPSVHLRAAESVVTQ